MQNNRGLQFDIQEADHFYLGSGAIGTSETQPDGQWDDFLPAKEFQNVNNVESMACTVFGSLNAWETFFNKMFHEEKNWSERFSAILANITQQGGSPHNTCEAIRKSGLIDQAELPFDETIQSWDEFYSPKPLTRHYLRKGEDFLLQYELFHEWVWRGFPSVEEKVQKIKEALTRAPVCISVYAWAENNDGTYRMAGTENHWTMCYGWTDKGWKVFDSYDNTHKIYGFDANISMAKLYWINKNPVHQGGNWLVDIFKNLYNIFK